MVKTSMITTANTAEQTSERPSSSTSSSEAKYKGVRKRKWGKWVSEIRLPNSRERIWLGSYDTSEKAARAFDAALFCLRGPDAKFNFPENPPSESDVIIRGGGGGGGGRRLSPQEIQAVASRFANQEQPPRNSSAPVDDNNNNNNDDDNDNDNNNCMSSSSEGGGGAVNVDTDTTIDWSFLNMLDSNEGASDFGFYSGINDHINMTADELYPPLPPPPIIDDNMEEQNDFSHTSSFLWNF